MTPARGALYIATAGSLALMARSVILGPIPMWVAGVALAGYLGLILCGVFILRLGMFVDVLWRGPVAARGVALTFDDGPSPETTPKVLDALDEAGVKATFFVIGRQVRCIPSWCGRSSRAATRSACMDTLTIGSSRCARPSRSGWISRARSR